MPEALAKAKHLRISPRKLRLVADLVRGRKVRDARDILAYCVKGGAPLIKKVLESAVANAESKAAESRLRIDTDTMVISQLLVNEGFTMKRMQAAPRGRRCLIRKRTSHVELWITDAPGQRS